MASVLLGHGPSSNVSAISLPTPPGRVRRNTAGVALTSVREDTISPETRPRVWSARPTLPGAVMNTSGPLPWNSERMGSATRVVTTDSTASVPFMLITGVHGHTRVDGIAGLPATVTTARVPPFSRKILCRLTDSSRPL